ncbi:MAG: nucleotide exchange factor GrpE, partial [Armatimonadetes bacterium]|nr:nucleotide exchange factor GrpE [Candidatus Hippobium faecium]
IYDENDNEEIQNSEQEEKTITPETEPEEKDTSESEKEEENTESELSEEVQLTLQDYEKLKEDFNELNDKYIRTLADFGNFKKRNFEETRQKIEKSKISLLKEIITINDTFDKALSEAEKNQSFENLLEGVQAIQKLVNFTLEKENVRPIDSVGEKFNPEIHDCILVVPVPGEEPETVIEETEKGYMINKTVVRPAKVVVSGGSPDISKTAEEKSEETETETVQENSTDETEIPINVIE